MHISIQLCKNKNSLSRVIIDDSLVRGGINTPSLDDHSRQIPLPDGSILGNRHCATSEIRVSIIMSVRKI
jgi:hypothetical protein